jgi:hypothetical protein
MFTVSVIYAQRMNCGDQGRPPSYSCMGNCWCEGEGGRGGQERCSFYCYDGEGGEIWCEWPDCEPEEPPI